RGRGDGAGGATVALRARRAACRVRARLGAGERAGTGHGEVRDSVLRARTGADLPDGRRAAGTGRPAAPGGAKTRGRRQAAARPRVSGVSGRGARLRPWGSGVFRPREPAEVPVRRRRGRHVESVVVVELEL